MKTSAEIRELYLKFFEEKLKEYEIENNEKNIQQINEQSNNQEKKRALPSSCSFHRKLLCLGCNNFTAVVGAASLASSVGHYGLTALGANRNAGSGELPVGATALIAAGLGHFTLRDSHGDTSLVELLLNSIIMDLLLKKLL